MGDTFYVLVLQGHVLDKPNLYGPNKFFLMRSCNMYYPDLVQHIMIYVT